MALVTDERAQSIQIGAVLVFGILIIFLSIWQAFVVPNQNEEIEFDHNQAVQQELTELRGVVNSMPDAASTRSTAVNLGVRYPSRAIFVNPGPTSGTLRTVGTTDESVNITFANVTAEGDVGDFWDDPGPYNTGFLSYEPNYNLYGNAPETVFENSVLYNDFGDSTGERNALSLTGQSLVDGDRISVVALNGSFSAGRSGAVSVDFLPVSTQTRTVDIEGDGGPVTLRIPTRLDNGTWTDILEEEAQLRDQGGNVERVDDGPGETVELVLRELPADESYSLRLAKVGLGTGVTPTEAAYLTDVTGDETTVGAGETRDVTVEVRDAFNGPVRDRLVNASAARGTLTTSSPRTGSDGRVTFRYEAPGSGGTDRLNFTIAEGVGSGDVGGDFRAGTPENVTMTVEVTELSGGGSGQSAFTTTWVDPTGEPGIEGCDDGSCTLNYTGAQKLNLTARTDPAAENAQVDFAVSNRSVGVVDPTSNPTGSDGEVTTTFKPRANGIVDVYAWSGGTGDVIEIEVTNFGDTLPKNAVAFDDANGNGIYDDGETTYTESDLYSGTFSNKGADLVIERDISAGDNTIDIKTNRVTVKSGVTLSTGSGRNMNIDAESDIDISGATLVARGKNADISIKAVGNVNADDAVLRFGRSVEAEADGGTLFVNDNGGTRDDGGTYIEDTDGNAADLSLKKGMVEGTPEKGNVV